MEKTEKITNIATKRGFFFPSGEIYSIKSGFWTYGHLGTLMKHKFEDLWRSYFLSLDPNYYEIEDANIMAKEADLQQAARAASVPGAMEQSLLAVRIVAGYCLLICVLMVAIMVQLLV